MSELSTPGDLLQLSGSYWKACVLHTTVMLDVFTPLENGPLEAVQLAKELHCEPRALRMLLNAATAIGLLRKDGASYSVTETAREHLVSGAPNHIGHIIRHHHRLMASWARLPEAVKGGKPTRVRDFSEDAREDFLMGMFNLACAIAPVLAEAIDLSGRKRLLDLGGGPGTYAVHFCMANPSLRAFVFDLPGSHQFARSVSERFGVQGQVGFIEGDYLKDPIPGTYDVAWLSHILHSEGEDGCMTILGKAAQALAPGGLLFIHEFILNDSMDGPEFPALFSLNMLLGTDSGQSYSEAQIRDMLARVGCHDVERLGFTGPNDSGVLRGIVG